MDRKNTEKDLQNAHILNLDDDFSLVKRFIDGDESVFAVLVQRHKEKVRNIIYLTMNSSNSVDDVAQDVFLTVYRNLNNFRFESQFTTWLYRVTVNKCKDHMRKIRIRNIFSPINEAENKTDDSISSENTDISGIVQKAISKLPEKLRVPLLLKDIEGMSYQEIAETVQCEIGTVKSRIFRAREGLKNLLKPFEEDLMK